ncbi:ABC transporter substrate-binding protein [Microvirga ossetica]|nr:extracellular solute-binding protein [Microvirga ossetica]
MSKLDFTRRAVLQGTVGMSIAALLARTVSAQDAKALSFWYEGATPEQQAALISILAKKFEEANPGTALNIEFRGAGLADQLLVSLAANSGPDLVLTNGPAWTGRFVGGKRLAPLDKYAAKFGWEAKIDPFALSLGKVDGKLYALPKTQEVQVLYFNKTLFDKNGYVPPKTNAEFTKIADDMLSKKIIPIASGNSGARYTNRHYVSVIWNCYSGPEAVYEALIGKRRWTDDVFVDGISMLKAWWDKGYFGGPRYFSLDSQQAFTFMAAGAYGMAMQGTWAFAWVPESFAKTGAELGYTPLPQFSENAPYPVFPYGIGSHIAINNTSKNKDAAAGVMDLMVDPSFVSTISNGWQGEWDIPLLKTGPEPTDPIAKLAHDIRTATAKALAEGTYGYTPWSFWPPKTDDYMKGGIEEVWLGSITPRQFCENVDKVFQEELAARVVTFPPARS